MACANPFFGRHDQGVIKLTTAHMKDIFDSCRFSHSCPATVVIPESFRVRGAYDRWFASWLLGLLAVALMSAGRVEAKTPVEVFRQASQSIVVIKTYDDKGKMLSSGSGVVLDKEGTVVTNFHVIEKASKLVVVSNKKDYPATPRFIDRVRDVCSISVPGLNVLPVTLANNSTLDIGSTVYAIGFPMAVGLTFSNGIVSSLREASGGHYIQFTAPISPGSSGGGLFDEQAQLIGIPTYFVSQGQLLNFALPVEWVVDLPHRHNTQVAAAQVVNKDQEFQKHTLSLKENEDWLSQIQLAEKWTKDFPTSIRAWELLGSAYANNGEFSKAIDAYRKVVELNPDLAQYWLELGLLYGKAGQVDKQIDSYRAAVRINPEYAGTWYRLAVVYRDAAQFANALQASLEVTRINPANLPALMIEGYSYGRLGQQTRQIEAFSQAIRIDEYSSDAYVCLGVAFGQARREADELKSYQKALAVTPDDASALFNLGHYYLGHGNKEMGMEYYSRLKTVDPKLVKIFFDDLNYRVYPETVVKR